MQQSLFSGSGEGAPDPVSAWLKMQARRQTTLFVALGLAAVAFVLLR